MMRAALLAALLAFGLRSAAAAECRLGQIASLPVQQTNGKLLVQGKINGNPTTLIFDTGMYSTVFAEAALGRLGLRVARGEEHEIGRLSTVTGINGDINTHPVEARNIDLGGLRARNYAFNAGNINLLGLADRVDGFLSADLLAKYDIDLDLQGGSIRLYYPLSDCSEPAARLEGPLYQAKLRSDSRERSPRLTVDIAGQSFDAVLDTGATHTTLFGRATRAAIAAYGPPARYVLLSGIAQGRESAGVLRLKTLGIGDLEFNNFPVAVIDHAYGTDRNRTDVLLGLDFVSRIHAWISYSSGTLIMQYPPKPSPL